MAKDDLEYEMSSDLKSSLAILIVMFFVCLIIVMVSNEQRDDEAKKMCNPLRVKHSYYDKETGKVRAVCADFDGKDTLL
jgi:hypothetical protein